MIIEAKTEMKLKKAGFEKVLACAEKAYMNNIGPLGYLGNDIFTHTGIAYAVRVNFSETKIGKKAIVEYPYVSEAGSKAFLKDLLGLKVLRGKRLLQAEALRRKLNKESKNNACQAALSAPLSSQKVGFVKIFDTAGEALAYTEERGMA